MYSGQFGGRDIGLKLQKLQLDLQVVAFADIARLVLGLGDIDRIAEALQIQFGETQCRFRQQNRNELLAYVEDKSSFFIRNLSFCDVGLVDRCLKPVLPFAAAFKQITYAQIELLHLVQIVIGEFVGREDRQKLRIEIERRIRAQICGNLLSLVLQNQGARCLQRVIVGQSQIDGLVEGDQCRGLS